MNSTLAAALVLALVTDSPFITNTLPACPGHPGIYSNECGVLGTSNTASSKMKCPENWTLVLTPDGYRCARELRRPE